VEIENRNLIMLGVYVQAPFKYPETHAAGKEKVLKIVRLLCHLTPEGNSYLMLADNNAEEPIRIQHAGRGTQDIALFPDELKAFIRGVREIATAVRDETGLPVLFYYHCPEYVATRAEIGCLLDNTAPALINLGFDPGHFVFGGGPCSPYNDC